MATQILVNICSGNGFLPDGTKPLPEPVLTYRSTDQWRLSKGNFARDNPSHQSQKTASICLNKISFKSPWGQWVNLWCPSSLIRVSFLGPQWVNLSLGVAFWHHDVLCWADGEPAHVVFPNRERQPPPGTWYQWPLGTSLVASNSVCCTVKFYTLRKIELKMYELLLVVC